MSDPDLSDFGGGSTRDPPVVRKHTAIHIPVGGEVRHVGFLVEMVGNDYEGTPFGYVTTRNSETHRLRKLAPDEGGSYAVSCHGLEEVERTAHRYGTGLHWFFVHELDTGDVYEWPMDALSTGPTVPDTFLETATDQQRYVTRDAADYVWRDHAPDDFFADYVDRESHE